MTAPMIRWNGGVQQEALDLLHADGGVVVSPTKVGYVILATDAEGLERKFSLKQRPLRKPGVVLCGSLDQLVALADVTDEALEFFRTHWRQDVLMGCILPWTDAGRAHIPAGAEPYVMDDRGTSCFVVRFGAPGESIARALWNTGHTLLFASSANPSGRGNRGVVSGIGERIATGVDLVIEADDYVASIQPGAGHRYEQGVMVSFVDAEGELVPEQHGVRGVTPAPTLIRAGLDLDRIMVNLAAQFPGWDYRHGQYY